MLSEGGGRFFEFGEGFEDERFGQDGFEEMFGGGEAGGDFGGVEEAGDAEEDGVGGFFAAKADGAFEAGFPEGAGEAENSRERTNGGLLLFTEFCEAIFLFGLGAAMKTNGPGHQIPLFGSPVGRNGKGEEKFANAFLGEVAAGGGADAVEFCGSLHQAAHRFFLKDGGGAGAAQKFEEAHGDAGDLACFADAGIGGAGGGANASEGGGFEALAMREIVAPIVPEAGFAKSELAVGFDTLVALVGDFFLPGFRGVGGGGGFGFVEEFGEDVEIVDIAEEILEALEIIAPGGGVFREETFEGVAEAFEADAERVPGLGLFGAESAVVEFLGFFKALEGQAFGGKATNGDDADTVAQVPLETRPIFFVELCGDAERFFGALLFVQFEGGKEVGTQRIIFGGEFFDPVFHHVGVADGAEAAEEFASEFAHFGPGGVGVDLFENGGEGTAAANGDAEVVDGVGIGGGVQAGELFKNAIHPVREAAVLEF